MTKTIVLLRHAEEPPSDRGSMDLSGRGRRRAERLAEFIPREFGTPAFLFVASPRGDSVRAYLTLRPLADATGVVIDGGYGSAEFANLAAKLRHDPRFDDALIAVAWTHKELPALAAALGAARDAFPTEWDEDVFDLCYEFRFRKTGPKVRRIKQPF